MKAVWNDKVIAEADKEDLIFIEGSWYFPPDSIKKEYLEPSQTHTNCFWKGEANYYNIKVADNVNEDSGWYYPVPMSGSIDKVKKDFTNYVAFWRGVEVKE